MNQLIKIALIVIVACCAVIFHSCGNGAKNNPVKEKSEVSLITKKSSTNSSQTAVSQKEAPTNFVRSGKQPTRSQFIASSSGNDQKSLEALKASLQSKPQEFIISSKTDTMIVGKAGTRVHIPATSFVDQEGKDIVGEIVFSLIECYTPLEMFAHHLSTLTTDGRLLETGGSVFVDAKQTDEQLQLKPGRKLQIDFPKGEMDLPGMQEFKGITNSTGIVEWNSVSSNRGLAKTAISRENLNNGSLNTVSGTAPQIYLIEMKNEEGKTDLSSLKLNNGEGTLADWLEKQTLKDGFLRGRFSNGYEVELRMSFDKKGKVAEIKSTRLVEQTTLDELYRFFMKVPPLDVSKIQSRELYPVTLEAKTLTKEKELKQYYTKHNLEWKAGYESGLSKKGDYYTLNVGWIGWVNCDRFKDFREKVNMAMNADDKTSVFLIFSKIAAQISPSRFENTVQFHALPLGEPIRLIALRVENDVIFMERIDTKVTSGFVKLNPVARVSKEEIKSAFEL